MRHFSIEVYEHTSVNNALVTIIGHNNSGEGSVTLESIKGFLECEKATMPSTFRDLEFYIEDLNNGTRVMQIGYIGRKLSLSITETEVREIVIDPELDKMAQLAFSL